MKLELSVYTGVTCSVYCGALFESNPFFIYGDSEVDSGPANCDFSRRTINHPMWLNVCVAIDRVTAENV